MAGVDEVLHDVRAEYQRLDQLLGGLSAEQWQAPSGAEGWSVCDVVVHLSVSEEAVAATIAAGAAEDTNWDGALDDAMAAIVDENRATPDAVLARWRAATSSSVDALAQADPNRRFTWAATPLRPGTMATTRLAEHWAHGLDITTPLGLQFGDTDRLRHIAWLGHATIPYGCSLQGIEPQPVRAELVGPTGATFTFGPDDAESRITGSLGAFCRVGAQRLSAEQSGLQADGPFARQALAVLRNYAA